MTERPAFVEVPTANGGTISAVVANRDGIAEVDVNGVPHIGLLLSVNAVSATIAVMTHVEAAQMANRLAVVSTVVAARLERMTIDVPNSAVVNDGRNGHGG